MRDVWTEKVNGYLGAIVGYEDSTKARIKKNLETVRVDLRRNEEVRIRKQGLSPTRPLAPAPGRIDEGHISALLERWKGADPDRGRKGALRKATVRRYLSDLEGWLGFCGNPVIERMRKMKHVRLPEGRGRARRPRTFSADELARLRAAAETIDGWRGSVAHFLVEFLSGTGIRPQEIVKQRMEDLNLAEGRLVVSCPKGDEDYAADDEEAIMSAAARQALTDFLQAREAYLAGEPSEWLLPLKHEVGPTTEDGTLAVVVGPWAPSTLRKLKADLQSRSGVVFPGLKTFRATFGQSALDAEGVDIEQVSLAMRHSTTSVTRRTTRGARRTWPSRRCGGRSIARCATRNRYEPRGAVLPLPRVPPGPLFLHWDVSAGVMVFGRSVSDALRTPNRDDL